MSPIILRVVPVILKPGVAVSTRNIDRPPREPFAYTPRSIPSRSSHRDTPGHGSFFLLALMDMHPARAVVVRNLVVMAAGMGVTFPIFMISVQNAFPHRVLGTVTGSIQFFRTVGESDVIHSQEAALEQVP